MLRIIASAFILNFIMLGVSLANNSTDKIIPQPMSTVKPDPPTTTVEPNITTTVAPNVTTTAPPPNSTTTIKPSTTTSKPTDPTTTKPPPSPPTTIAPNVTTSAPTHAPNVTTPSPTHAPPNVTTAIPTPTAKPVPPSDRKFDAFSFLGGFSLALGLVAIAFLSWKFYMSRQENVYHTL